MMRYGVIDGRFSLCAIAALCIFGDISATPNNAIGIRAERTSILERFRNILHPQMVNTPEMGQGGNGDVFFMRLPLLAHPQQLVQLVLAVHHIQESARVRIVEAGRLELDESDHSWNFTHMIEQLEPDAIVSVSDVNSESSN